MKNKTDAFPRLWLFLWREGGGVGIEPPRWHPDRWAVDYTCPIKTTHGPGRKREREKERKAEWGLLWTCLIFSASHSMKHNERNMWRLCQRSGASALAITAATQMLTFSSPLEGDKWLFSPERGKQRGSPEKRHPHVPVSESDSRAFWGFSSTARRKLLQNFRGISEPVFLDCLDIIILLLLIFRICFYFYIFCLYFNFSVLFKIYFISI